jgi:hypothetical protein
VENVNCIITAYLFSNHVTITYLADILLKTALKKFKLNANKTLHAKFFNCNTVGLSFGTPAKKK